MTPIVCLREQEKVYAEADEVVQDALQRLQLLHADDRRPDAGGRVRLHVQLSLQLRTIPSLHAASSSPALFASARPICWCLDCMDPHMGKSPCCLRAAGACTQQVPLAFSRPVMKVMAGE